MSATWGRSRAARRRGVSPNQELVERLAAMERERDAARLDAAQCRQEWSKIASRAHRAEREVDRLESELAEAEDCELTLAGEARRLRQAVGAVAAQLDVSSAYWNKKAAETAEGSRNEIQLERRLWRARVFAQLRDDLYEALGQEVR
jgi:hypothetical protein